MTLWEYPPVGTTTRRKRWSFSVHPMPRVLPYERNDCCWSSTSFHVQQIGMQYKMRNGQLSKITFNRRRRSTANSMVATWTASWGSVPKGSKSTVWKFLMYFYYGCWRKSLEMLNVQNIVCMMEQMEGDPVVWSTWTNQSSKIPPKAQLVRKLT